MNLHFGRRSWNHSCQRFALMLVYFCLLSTQLLAIEGGLQTESRVRLDSPVAERLRIRPVRAIAYANNKTKQAAGDPPPKGDPKKPAKVDSNRKNNVGLFLSNDQINNLSNLYCGPVQSRIYRLKHARAVDVRSLLDPLLSPIGEISSTPRGKKGLGPEPGTPGILFGRINAQPNKSQVTVGPVIGQTGFVDDTGGDSYAQCEIVIIRDYCSVFRNVECLLCEIDRPPLQVLIEATLINLRHFGDRDIGFNYAVLDGAGQFVSVVGSAALMNDIGGFSAVGNLVTGFGELQRGRELTPSGTFEHGGPMRNEGRRGFDTLDHGFKQGISTEKVTAFIRALKQIGSVEILSSPRLLVVNRQKAEVLVGRRTPYKTVATSGSGDILVEQVNYLESGTRLRLRPFISVEDQTVRMEVHPERSLEFTSSVNGLPGTEISTVTTNVMVPNGGMVIIGGLLEDEETVFEEGIPYLMDLPYIGALFRLRTRGTAKTELIVMLRPTIVCPPTAVLNTRPAHLGKIDRFSPDRYPVRLPPITLRSSETHFPLE